MRGRNSNIVTSDPSRFQTEPSSSPTAPAPMTISFFGASVKANASVLLTIVLPSNFANGSSVGARAIDDDAVLGRLFFDKHQVVGRCQERFARDAAHVQASATQFLVFFDESGFQAELACADCGDVATRAGADDNDIKFFHNYCE